MARAYLIRYGLARAVARFAADPDAGQVAFGRGDPVVIRTHRGVELGEVLAEAPDGFEAETPSAPILRAAGPDDLDRAREVAEERSSRFEACLGVFSEGRWPIEPIDAEPLLEAGRTVLHYLGPHRLDASGLVAALRARSGLDVVLEPAGRDVVEEEALEAPGEVEAGGCGSCGSSGGGARLVFTEQKRQPRVQVSPMSMMVAVAADLSSPPQQSLMFGHRASSQTVCRFRPRRSAFIFL